MTASLAITTVAYALVIAFWAALGTGAGGGASPALDAAVLVLLGAVCLQAFVGALALIGGHRPPDVPVTIGYLAASVIIGPLGLSVAGTGARGRNGFAVAIIAIAIAAVTLRLLATWTAAG